MPLSCSRCHKDSGLDGTISGVWWTCGPCLTTQVAERKAEAIRRTAQARHEVLVEGRFTILVPGARLPSSTTDLEAQQYADEHHGIKWERQKNEIIIWCEM